MFPGGWWLLYVRIFSYTSHGCAYHTNCLSEKQKNKILSVGVFSLKEKKGFKFPYTSHAGGFLYGISSSTGKESQ